MDSVNINNEAMEKGKLLSFKRTFPDYHKFDEKHCYWNRGVFAQTDISD